MPTTATSLAYASFRAFDGSIDREGGGEALRDSRMMQRHLKCARMDRNPREGERERMLEMAIMRAK